MYPEKGLHKIPRMKPYLLLIIAVLIFDCSLSAAKQVAVFDFDDRTNEKETTASYIEKKLKQADKDLLVFQLSGRGNVPESVKIMKDLDEKGYDLIIIITSDALIIANHVIKRTPTLFTNVNNPLSLGCRTLGPSGGRISGASYYISIEKQVNFYKKLLPGLKIMGFVFDSNNKSKKVELPEVRATCEKLGLDYRIAVVSKINQLNTTVNQLINEGVDALCMGSSGMLYNHISSFIAICDQKKIPVFSFNKKGLKQGAVAALASDYNLMADRLVIPMALDVLQKGISPGKMPVAFLEESLMFINLSQAGKLNLSIPPEILEQAIISH